MSDREVEELEQILLPFALARFDLDNYKSNFPMGKMAMNIAKRMMGNWINDYVTWLVRAFTRCLVLAEASFMQGIGPWGPFQMQMGQAGGGDRSAMEPQVETEAHAWLLHLQEIDKLPGMYERFTGRYFIK